MYIWIMLLQTYLVYNYIKLQHTILSPMEILNDKSGWSADSAVFKFWTGNTLLHEHKKMKQDLDISRELLLLYANRLGKPKYCYITVVRFAMVYDSDTTCYVSQLVLWQWHNVLQAKVINYLFDIDTYEKWSVKSKSGFSKIEHAYSRSALRLKHYFSFNIMC